MRFRSRRPAREAALKALYQIEIGKSGLEDAVIEMRENASFEEDLAVYAEGLIRGVTEHSEDIKDALVLRLADLRLLATAPSSVAVINQRPPDRSTATAVADANLTIAEWRVAVLAARGDTNRAISEKLHVTVSTVEQHLTRAYRKLQVTGRRDLPLLHELMPTRFTRP